MEQQHPKTKTHKIVGTPLYFENYEEIIVFNDLLQFKSSSDIIQNLIIYYNDNTQLFLNDFILVDKFGNNNRFLIYDDYVLGNKNSYDLFIVQ